MKFGTNVNIWYFLGHLCEFLLFIYYTNTSFYPRKSYIKNNILSLIGYMFLFVIGIFGVVPISVLSFFVINAVLLVYGYNIKLTNAIFYSLILDTLSCIGEYVVLDLLGIRYFAVWNPLNDYQGMILTIGGKLVYLLGIIFLKNFTKKHIKNDSNSEFILAVIPLITLICLTVMMSSEINQNIFLMVCSTFLTVNFVTFYVNARLTDKNQKLQILQDEYNQNKAELSEYQLLAEKYENTKIMRHDFHKQLDVLKDLIKEDNKQAAEYMKQIRFAQRELDYAQYTDNKIFNILLSQKVKECHNHGIEIHIHSDFPKLSFISDIDTVAVFSNMLDNAIEGCKESAKKEIYVDMYTVNNSYTAVRIENYTNKEPVVLDGILRTQKQNSDIHGIGVKSINRALKKYGSELTWSYNKENKFFRALALIHIPK